MEFQIPTGQKVSRLPATSYKIIHHLTNTKNEITVTLLNLKIVTCVILWVRFCAKLVSKASRRSASAYHLDIRGKFEEEEERRKSNSCSTPLTSYSMLFVAGKNLCNIYFQTYGKSGNLESGTGNGTATATGVKWVTLKPFQPWNLSRYIIWDGVSSLISFWDTIRTFSNWENDLKKVSETITVIPGSHRPWLQVLLIYLPNYYYLIYPDDFWHEIDLSRGNSQQQKGSGL